MVIGREPFYKCAKRREDIFSMETQKTLALCLKTRLFIEREFSSMAEGLIEKQVDYFDPVKAFALLDKEGEGVINADDVSSVVLNV